MALTAEDIGSFREMVEDVITRRVDPQFEQVDRRFEQVDARFEQVDLRFDQVDLRFGELKSEIVSEVEARIEAAKDEVVADVCDVMREGFTLVGRRLGEMDGRLDGLERRLDSLKIVSNI